MDGFRKGIEKTPKWPWKRKCLLRYNIDAIDLYAGCLQRYGKILRQAGELPRLRVMHNQHFFHYLPCNE